MTEYQNTIPRDIIYLCSWYHTGLCKTAEQIKTSENRKNREDFKDYYEEFCSALGIGCEYKKMLRNYWF